MTKQIHRISVALLLFLMAICALQISANAAPAAGSAPLLSDEAGLLSAAEAASLNTTLEELSAAHGARIAVYTLKDLHGKSAALAANEINDRLAPTAENGAIVLLIAPKDRDWHISSSSKMRTRITDGRCMDALTEAVLPNLRENRYADAFTAYAKTTDMMLTHYEKEGTPYDPRTAFNATALGIAALLAVAIFCLVRCFLIRKMSNIAAAAAADAYLDHKSFHLTQSDDNYITSRVVRMAKAKSSSSSSSSSGGGSHGGTGGKY